MADLTYTYKATERKGSAGIAAGKGDAHNLKMLLCSTIELAASTATSVTAKIGTIPSNARISGLSTIYWDDLASTGSPTIDVGLGSVDSNITSDADALSNGHDVSSAGSASLITDKANHGKQAYLFVNGQTTDPGGLLDVYISRLDASTTATGTVTVEVLGFLD